MKRRLKVGLALACSAWVAEASAQRCEARADARPPAIVELYTSEGCSSCPPADRWLSSLKGRRDVLALAFHVNYWDRLGWPDRFATPATTERQHQLAQGNGSGYVYTPQVVVNGHDLRNWRGSEPQRLPTSALTLSLRREGPTVTAQIGPAAGRLAGYWAVLEDGHASRVRAGENAGQTLRHDHVVTAYQPVGAWTADATRTWRLTLPAPAADITRRVVFIVTEPTSQRPLQAVAIDC